MDKTIKFYRVYGFDHAMGVGGKYAFKGIWMRGKYGKWFAD